MKSEPIVQSQASGTALAPRPLMTIGAVMWRLDLDEDAVVRLIDDGHLRWAFNISCDRSRSRYIRILAQSVTDYLDRRFSTEDTKDAWDQVAKLIFPAKPVLVTYELTRALNCGREHALNLIKEGNHFQLAPCTIRPGPKGTARIWTASAARWLQKRRII